MALQIQEGQFSAIASQRYLACCRIKPTMTERETSAVESVCCTAALDGYKTIRALLAGAVSDTYLVPLYTIAQSVNRRGRLSGISNINAKITVH